MTPTTTPSSVGEGICDVLDGSVPWTVVQGDCRDVLASMPEACVHAIVCDPPYGIGFMGKDWDTPGAFVERKAVRSNRFDHVGGNHNPVDAADAARTRRVEAQRFQEWVGTWAVEALRVLKPGGHLLAFGGTRTYHRLTCALEDAGFEVRDCLAWMYGSGFPKSKDVSKAIDEEAGAEREVVGRKSDPRYAYAFNGTASSPMGSIDPRRAREDHALVTAPATDAAREWDGWGTALKPAFEPIVLARKPLIGTVAQNVLAHGTGGINVDGCRVGAAPRPHIERRNDKALDGEVYGSGINGSRSLGSFSLGRWPANVVLDEEAAAMLDEMSGESRPKAERVGLRGGSGVFGQEGIGSPNGVGRWPADAGGGASRFFYCAKVSREEREAGCASLPAKQLDEARDEDAAGANNPRNRGGARVRNHHPTLKPIELMRWLVRLVTPLGGIVLDPFAGAGSCGCAAVLERVRYIGIEREGEYVPIGRARVAHWAATDEAMQVSLFAEAPASQGRP